MRLGLKLCCTLVSSLLGVSSPLLAAPSLDVFAGLVGGAGGGIAPQGCSSFGPSALLSSFFTFAGPSLPAGGIVPCGYVGAIDQVSGASGPLTISRSIGPVALDGFGASFTGQVNAVASFGQLGASARAQISGLTGNPVALFEGSGAARFSDTLTATSPLVANLSAGYVRYQFQLDGSQMALGAPAAYFFGETYTVLDVQHQGGPNYEVLNAHIRRGGLGTISNGLPPFGWSTSSGSLSGGSTFYSLMLPMTWGQSWDVSVGLLAWAYGTADNDFLTTAKLTGFEMFDAQQQRVMQFSVSADSGTVYAGAVPEAPAPAMLLAGLGGLWLAVRRRTQLR